MSEPCLYIHLGPGKTATTFLQNVVLAKVRSVESLVEPVVELGEEEVRFGDLFNFPLQVWEDSGAAAFAHLIQNRERQGSLIISDEHVFGGLASPRPWMIPDPLRKIGPIVRLCRQMNGQTETYSMAAHLKKISDVATKWGFADTKVLAATRRQDTRLASGYAQVSDRVRGASQEGFEIWVRHLTQNPVGYYIGGGLKLDYLAWYNEIESAVGANSLCMLPFELLEENEGDFVRRYLTMLGVEESDANRVVDDLGSGNQKQNVSSKTESVWMLREPVRTGPRLRPARLWSALGLPGRLPLRLPDFSREKSISLTPDLSREILDVYEQSNRQLDNVLPELELSRYDYY